MDVKHGNKPSPSRVNGATPEKPAKRATRKNAPVDPLTSGMRRHLMEDESRRLDGRVECAAKPRQDTHAATPIASEMEPFTKLVRQFGEISRARINEMDRRPVVCMACLNSHDRVRSHTAVHWCRDDARTCRTCDCVMVPCAEVTGIPMYKCAACQASVPFLREKNAYGMRNRYYVHFTVEKLAYAEYSCDTDVMNMHNCSSCSGVSTCSFNGFVSATMVREMQAVKRKTATTVAVAAAAEAAASVTQLQLPAVSAWTKPAVVCVQASDPVSNVDVFQLPQFGMFGDMTQQIGQSTQSAYDKMFAGIVQRDKELFHWLFYAFLNFTRDSCEIGSLDDAVRVCKLAYSAAISMQPSPIQ
jgi:hypothetical protein